MAPSPLTTSPDFLASPHTLEDFVGNWERGTLDRSQWTHAAHVAVAARYAYLLAPEDAFEAMRSGILHFNASVGTSNTDSSGYHETLTRFWCQTIGDFVRRGNFAAVHTAVCRAVEEYGNQRDLHRTFYDYDVVADPRARKEWVRPHGHSQ